MLLAACNWTVCPVGVLMVAMLAGLMTEAEGCWGNWMMLGLCGINIVPPLVEVVAKVTTVLVGTIFGV